MVRSNNSADTEGQAQWRRETSAAESATPSGSGLVARGVSIHNGIVIRPTGRWAPSVHDLLRWLRSQQYTFAPRPISYTADTEKLEFIHGREQGWPYNETIQSIEGAFECGAFAQHLTQLLALYPCPEDAVWRDTKGAPGPGMQVQHGDLGPWNLLWSDTGPGVCGVIDWDQAEPGYPTYDIGFLAWFIVPMMDDESARRRGFSAPPDRKARLRAFAAGAASTPSSILSEVGKAQQEFIRRVLQRADQGDSAIWSRLREMGFHESAERDFTFTQGYRIGH